MSPVDKIRLTSAEIFADDGLEDADIISDNIEEFMGLLPENPEDKRF